MNDAHRPYERPALERYGTFRDLTRVGSDNDGDGGLLWGWSADVTNGCNANEYFPGASCSR
jgi:hypothetical protein